MVTRLRTSAGFTLVELMVVLVLLSLVCSSLVIVQRTVGSLQRSTLERAPLVDSSRVIDAALRASVSSASCLDSPAAGAANESLKGRIGEDCDGTKTLASATRRFMFCVDSASGQLRYWTGTAGTYPGNCQGAGFAALSSPLVNAQVAGGGFLRNLGPRNRVRAWLDLSLALTSSGERWAAADTTMVFRATYTALAMPLEAP